MATVGLRDLHFFPITKDDEEGTTYEEPVRIGLAMTANVQPQFNSADLRAEDGVAETAEARGATTVTVQTEDITKQAQSKILDKKINSDGVLMDSEDDRPPYGALAFRSEKANGKYRYVVLYKGKFTPPESNYETKQETPAFQTPTINGRFIRRHSDNMHGAQVDEDDEGMEQSIIDNWFSDVYEETPEL
ncbi:phage major tail protein, phi13 family [Gracilibacillus orientalis]|uniref:Phage major tail protein, phi13 family n=1 Tax=Gracilibacillus orientalis TaxID=334253 RepID=A0A1I4HAY2_9BACI|nr:major tail protein [Gracilibacillus orientalis]SFL38833.1 phage major tail protein, phi13 family [Gracilibacillus orientalis]